MMDTAAIHAIETIAGRERPEFSETTLYPELWVSLASLLRSYTAAHGLNRKQQATIELGEDDIVARAGDRWLKLHRGGAEIVWTREDGTRGLMRFTIEGKLQTRVGHEELVHADEEQEEEMDMQAEAWARELMQ